MAWAAGTYPEPVPGTQNTQAIPATYIYHSDQPRNDIGDYAEGNRNVTFSAGKWAHIRLHVKMNTPGNKDGSKPGIPDGFMKFYIDHELAGERIGIRWRDKIAEGINVLYLNAYRHSGQPPKGYCYDDFVIYEGPPKEQMGRISGNVFFSNDVGTMYIKL